MEETNLNSLADPNLRDALKTWATTGEDPPQTNPSEQSSGGTETPPSKSGESGRNGPNPKKTASGQETGAKSKGKNARLIETLRTRISELEEQLQEPTVEELLSTITELEERAPERSETLHFGIEFSLMRHMKNVHNREQELLERKTHWYEFGRRILLRGLRASGMPYEAQTETDEKEIEPGKAANE